MPSQVVRERLSSIVDVLLASHRGGRSLSSPSKGSEREDFIRLVLRNVISQPFRIGTGDIVDRSDNSSGQVDTVIEYANTLSFPILEADSQRLYLAESICAVIEIKSNLPVQWAEAVRKAELIARLQRRAGGVGMIGKGPPDKIPVFVVGYEGWKDIATVRENLARCNETAIIVSGILQLHPCLYVCHEGIYKQHGFEDERGLFGFLLSIEQPTSSMLGSKPPFMAYVR